MNGKALDKPITILQITGISCMDCAQKFEKAVNELPGVVQARLNAVTGKLSIEGNVDLKAIQELGAEEDYIISSDTSLTKSRITVFKIDGISCMDCAQKFEKAVSELPGVVKATLNTMTGKLTVEGEANVTAIQELGKEEDYTITPEASQAVATQQIAGPDWEMRRVIISGISLVTAFLLEKFGGPIAGYLSLYVVAMVLGGWDNFKKAGRGLRRFNFNMSVLMSVAVIGAFAIGQYEEGASVAFLFAISEMLEAWTVDRARRSIRELMDIAPAVASVRRGDSEYEIPAEDILVGDIIIVRPGEKIAMDGVIIKGESAINQAAITGEALPVERGPGAEVFAGTLNTHGSLEIEVTKLVKDTTIAKIIHMVEEAQSKRAPSQAFVDKFAAVYTPIVMALAVGIIIIPPVFLQQEWIPWIYRGLSLMVVACPCALVISTPVAIVSAISNAAKNGVLIKGGVYLEETAALKAIAFDKTGTLTKGKPELTDLIPVQLQSEDTLLKIAAKLEVRSEHPLAEAIVRAAEDRHLAVVPAEDFSAITGRGAKGTIDGETVYIGNTHLFMEIGAPIETVMKDVERLEGEGKTVMIVGTKEKVFGLVAVADEVRSESANAIMALKRAGIERTVMLTGDNPATAKAIAAKVGVDEFRAELLPEDKVAAIEELLKKHGKVAMIGDGINDAPALAVSTVGIAMGGAGTDTALETADIVLMADDLTKLPFTIRLSRAALNIIRQNIGFSLVIKIVAVLAVFPGWLTLWLAILADMGATILVTLNSLRLINVRAKE
jgi:Cd2+/Zn2+-exporting ATPase